MCNYQNLVTDFSSSRLSFGGSQLSDRFKYFGSSSTIFAMSGEVKWSRCPTPSRNSSGVGRDRRTPITSKDINPFVFTVKNRNTVFTALFWLSPLKNGVTPLAPFLSGASLSADLETPKHLASVMFYHRKRLSISSRKPRILCCSSYGFRCCC